MRQIPASARAVLLSLAAFPCTHAEAWAGQPASAELRSLPKPSAAGVAANPAPLPGCPALPPPGHVVPSRLIARDTARADVGPYTVTLPGYATDPAGAAHDSYAPFLVEAKPGDTLRFDLQNLLTGEPHPNDHTNLHTHGLLVTPREDKPCGPPGDYVFVDEAAPGLVRYRMDIPATLPGQEFGTGTAAQPYPSGLLWFHAHLHGAARNQVMAGQSGVLAIGQPLDGLQTADPAKLAQVRTSTEVRYLALRDIQLAVPPGATPDNLPHPAATWIHNAQTVSGNVATSENYDSGACGGLTPPPPPDHPLGPLGWCSQKGVTVTAVTTNPDGSTTTATTTDNTRDTVWLFTVNGQLYPQVTLPDPTPGSKHLPNQIWRIANLSANVTYILELEDDTTGAEQDMLVLAMDGVVAGTGATGTQGVLGVKLKRVLLMPASRAELFVSNDTGSERNLTFRTAGIETGPGGASPPTGDSWPSLALAHVHMLPRMGQTLSLAAVQSIRLARPQATLSGDLAEPAMRALMHAPALAAGAGAAAALLPAVPAGCVTLPGPVGGATYRRQITFEQDDSGFKLGSTVTDQDGHELDAAHRIPASAYPPPSAHPPPDHSWPNPDKWVCARFGAQEVWELVNNTDEMHNFHIHQSKFRLARQGDPGAPPDLAAPQSSTCAGPGTPVVCDPFPVLGANLVDWSGAESTAGVDVWHDTIPVPPRSADGKTPGRTFVSIPFKAPGQIGRFVFHCHILEHEDGGMMAPMQVLSPFLAFAEAGPPRDGGVMAAAGHHH